MTAVQNTEPVLPITSREVKEHAMKPVAIKALELS
jgi:hypothetical protein